MLDEILNTGRHRRTLVVALNTAALPDDNFSLTMLAALIIKRTVLGAKAFPLAAKHGSAIIMYLEAALNGAGTAAIPPAIAREYPRVVPALRELSVMLCEAGKAEITNALESGAFVCAKLPYLLASILEANELLVCWHQDSLPTQLVSVFSLFLLHAAQDALEGTAFSSYLVASLESAESLLPGFHMIDANLLRWQPAAAAPASSSLPSVRTPPHDRDPARQRAAAGPASSLPWPAADGAEGAWTPTSGSAMSFPVSASARERAVASGSIERRRICKKMLGQTVAIRSSLAALRSAMEEAARELLSSFHLVSVMQRAGQLQTRPPELPVVFDLRRRESSSPGLFCCLYAEARKGQRALEAQEGGRLVVLHPAQPSRRLFMEFDGLFLNSTPLSEMDEVLGLEAILASSAAGEGDAPCFIICGSEASPVSSPSRNALGSDRRPGLIVRVLALLFQLREEAIRGAIAGQAEDWEVNLSFIDVVPSGSTSSEASVKSNTPRAAHSSSTPKSTQDSARNPTTARRMLNLATPSAKASKQPQSSKAIAPGTVHLACDTLQEAVDFLRFACPPLEPAPSGAAGPLLPWARHRIIEVLVNQHQANVQWRTSSFRLTFVTIDTSDGPNLNDVAHVLATPGDLAAILQRRRSAAGALSAATGAPQRLADLLRDRLRPGTPLQIVGHLCDSATEDTQNTLEFLAKSRGKTLSWSLASAPATETTASAPDLALTLARRMKKESQAHSEECAKLRSEAQAAEARARHASLEVHSLRAVVRQLQAQVSRARRGIQHEGSVQQLRRAMQESVARANAAAAEAARISGLSAAGLSVADAIAGASPAPIIEEEAEGDVWSVADSAAAVAQSGSEPDMQVTDAAAEVAAAEADAAELRREVAALHAELGAGRAALRARDAQIADLRERLASAEQEKEEEIRALDARVDQLVEQQHGLALHALHRDDEAHAAAQKRSAALEAALAKTRADLQAAAAREAALLREKSESDGVAHQWAERAQELEAQIAALEEQLHARADAADGDAGEELREHAAALEASNLELRSQVAHLEAENAQLRMNTEVARKRAHAGDQQQAALEAAGRAAQLEAALAAKDAELRSQAQHAQEHESMLLDSVKVIEETEKRLRHVQARPSAAPPAHACTPGRPCPSAEHSLDARLYGGHAPRRYACFRHGP
eukprot:tig00020556_g11020.t1